MPTPFSRWLRLGLVAIGLPSFGAGVVAVFITDNGTGSGVLVAFGGVVLVLAALGGRIDSLEFGGAKLRMRAVAAQKYAQAEELASRGEMDRAGRLREEAADLLAAADPIASEYRRVRDSLPSGPERTRRLEEVFAKARGQDTGAFSPEQVYRQLREGDDGQRIAALAWMMTEPRLRGFDALLEAFTHSRSAFEQYYSLSLAARMVDGLDTDQRARLADAIRSQRGTRFGPDSDRWMLSELILARLAP